MFNADATVSIGECDDAARVRSPLATANHVQGMCIHNEVVSQKQQIESSCPVR
jgi:hypothetical protein